MVGDEECGVLQCKGKRHKESKPKTSVTYTVHIMAKNTDKHINVLSVLLQCHVHISSACKCLLW